MRYRNTTLAFYGSLREILRNGHLIKVRGQEIKEVISSTVSIERPKERVYVIPQRNNNIFSTIAETIWVIGGRNDLDYLSYYLPRAKEFSDDGKTWRAGYGVRLRHWEPDIDQLKEVISILSQDRNSRRAVMIIFNPSQDFIISKDIPCNNWLHFIIRDNKLHMNVAIRSNDLMWGFSGINTFEWSVLQEMMAYWTGVEVGFAAFFIGSLHLYNRHFKRAEHILENRKRMTLYDFGFSGPKFNTPFQELDDTLSEWFDLETRIRKGNNISPKAISRFSDGFLRDSLLMLDIYIKYLNGAEEGEINQSLHLLPTGDFRVAALEYLFRSNDKWDFSILRPEEVKFLHYYRQK